MTDEDARTVPLSVVVALVAVLLSVIVHFAVGWSWITEARVALVVTIAASLIGTVYVRGQTKEMRALQQEALSEERERHAKEIALLREELDESKKQFARTGAVLELDGRFEEHETDRRRDTVNVTVKNVGRMTAHVVRTSLHVGGDFYEVLDEGETVDLESGKRWEFSATRGDLSVFDAAARRWRGAHVTVRVETGDGRVWYWNEEDGEDATLNIVLGSEDRRGVVVVSTRRSDQTASG